MRGEDSPRRGGTGRRVLGRGAPGGAVPKTGQRRTPGMPPTGEEEREEDKDRGGVSGGGGAGGGDADSGGEEA